MKYDIVEQCAKKVGLPPKILFTFAYFYVESPCMRETSQKEYVEWCKSGRYSRAVEDCCLDILAERVAIIDGMPAVAEYKKLTEKK